LSLGAVVRNVRVLRPRLGSNSLFSLPLGEQTFEWTVWLSEDALWDRFKTMGHVAQLDEAGLKDTRAVFDDAMKCDDVVKNDKGEVEMPGLTLVVWTSGIP
jgi:hypothetical protein